MFAVNLHISELSGSLICIQMAFDGVTEAFTLKRDAVKNKEQRVVEDAVLGLTEHDGRTPGSHC